MKSFLEPLRQFFTFYHFYGIYAHINSPSCCLKKTICRFFFPFSVPSNTTTPQNTFYSIVREAFYGIGKALFCAKGICEQEKLMLLKAPHIKIFFFSRRGKSLCYFAKKSTRRERSTINII